MWSSSEQFSTGTPPTEESGPLTENTLSRIHVANANVEEQIEHFQDVHRLRLPAAVNDENVRVPVVEPAATRGTGVPPASMSWSRKGKFWSKSNQFHWCVELMSRWMLSNHQK